MYTAPVQAKLNEILAFLQHFFAIHSYAPTYRQIMVGTGLSSTCQVKPYLDKLMHQGLVTMEPDNPKSLRLTEKGRNDPNRPKARVAAYVSKTARINAAAVTRTVQLPVVGRTFAGQTTPIPDTSLSSYDEYTTIEVSEDILPPRAKWAYYFVLEVSGDSMIEAGIFSGDYVICRKSDTAQNNEMVVALLTDSNETTLKYFHRENGYVRLQPANSAMQPIIIHDTSHLTIQGVVERVVHCREYKL